ncbi:hypothetical protein [Paenibacillus antibioticophila]|uniref:hypothetical protein n=1 Tax=Paenibacillus antibioticophila TaxID=1274374 RepID=UPI001BB302A4|nr:hypothetical protein [Paenibacillus antibioticophila]
MQIGSLEHCSCIYHSPSIVGAGKQTARTETGRSFNQYLAPLLTGMLYPSPMQSNGVSSGNLANLLPLFMLSSTLSPFGGFNGMNNSSLPLMPLLLGTGIGSTTFTQPYSRYQSPLLSSQLQPTSRFNLTL